MHLGATIQAVKENGSTSSSFVERKKGRMWTIFIWNDNRILRVEIQIVNIHLRRTRHDLHSRVRIYISCNLIRTVRSIGTEARGRNVKLKVRISPSRSHHLIGCISTCFYQTVPICIFWGVLKCLTSMERKPHLQGRAFSTKDCPIQMSGVQIVKEKVMEDTRISNIRNFYRPLVRPQEEMALT